MRRALALAAVLAVVPAGAAAAPSPSGRPVPILMYHVIGDPHPGAPYPGLYVRPHDFVAQMHALAGAGYHAVTQRQVFEYWRAKGTLPAKPIVLSFDDGYLGDETVALPTLRSLHWPGVLNLQVDNLARGRVVNLKRAGWEIDAHTFTHPDLTHVDAARLWREVDGSRREIQRRYHVPVLFFCYPAGRYNAAVVDAVRRAGYWGATTTIVGLARPADPYTLNRVRVSEGQTAAGLLAELSSLHAG
jgi:peptidoglycan/xylan/chitin deacetylase (PgdA/CDA1 family)